MFHAGAGDAFTIGVGRWSSHAWKSVSPLEVIHQLSLIASQDRKRPVASCHPTLLISGNPGPQVMLRIDG